MNITNIAKVALATTCIIGGLHAHAAGFEKSVMWSGKWAGLGGAAAGAVNGADSIFYNPAGLVSGAESEASLNYSPLRTQTSGAQTADDEKLDSEKGLKHIFGVTAKHNINKDFAFGVGTYVSGGAGSSFENVEYGDIHPNFASLDPDVESSVQLMEIGLGGAYRLNKNWSFGATYRISIARANFSSAVIKSGVLLINSKFNDMKDTNLKGFRLGTQYISDDKNWGLGASYRSEIDLSLKGDAEGQSVSIGDGVARDMTDGDNATLSSKFPRQLNIGGFYNYSKRGTIFTEYSWSDYSQNNKIKTAGELKLAALHGSTKLLEGNSIALNWKDAHAVKVGHEYRFDSWALRAGYAFTSKVTSDDSVSITFSAPGVGHTATLGAGTAFMNDTLFVDFAGEYSRSAGGGTRNDQAVTGKYASSAIGLHSSVRYTF